MNALGCNHKNTIKNRESMNCIIIRCRINEMTEYGDFEMALDLTVFIIRQIFE